MIEELHVKNLALIEDATICPGSGLTVLTGETGAGKSALLSAVKLLIGERAEASQVRQGSDFLLVEACVSSAADAGEFPDGHVVSRRVSSEGRSRCSLDGSLCTVGQLAQAVGSNIDLCGQHDHQKLLTPANHLALLDAWLREDLAAPLEAYQKAWRARAQAQKAYDAAYADSHQSAQVVDEARFCIERFEEVRPQPDEYDELQRNLPKMEHAESLLEACEQARSAISDEQGALDALNSALVALEGAARFDDELEALCSSLREAIFPVEDAAREIRRYRDAVDFDEGELARCEQRLGELMGLMRSFGPTMPDVFDRYERARRVVLACDDTQETLRRAQEALDAAEHELVRAASLLSLARGKRAPLFAAQVNEQMARLEMGGARLDVSVAALDRAQWGLGGADAVEFLYRPGASMQPRPLAKIASGGELSRVMLSIKVVLGERDDVETLIFDEIDTGVGGSTARAIAQVIAELARTRQVIVVTHLAQLAVVAQRHYVVSKDEGPAGSIPKTTLCAVEGEARVREVARLLSGDEDAATMEHARVLLDKALA